MRSKKSKVALVLVFIVFGSALNGRADQFRGNIDAMGANTSEGLWRDRQVALEDKMKGTVVDAALLKLDQHLTDANIVDELYKAKTCNAEGSEMYCFAKFRGLDVEFAAVTSNSPTLFIHALGNKQNITPYGSACLQVFMLDDDLKQGIIPAQIILRNDGNIFTPEQLAADEKGCK